MKKNKKEYRFTLRKRLTVLIGITILFSLLIALGGVLLISWLFPSSRETNVLWQMPVISLVVGLICSWFMSKLFFDPIKKLQEGMKTVEKGNFAVRLNDQGLSSEMKDLFLGFNMMAKELSATEIIQADFVANVSHEFKTPINAIEGYATLLQGADGIKPDEREYVEKILFNTQRLSSLVSNVLLLSKLENQQIQPKPIKFNLAEQIREAVVALERAWTEKNIEFDVELSDVEYFGNEKILYHAFSNLISNAVKFSPENSVVKLRLKKENQAVVFSVEDQGPGLPEKAKEHLFDKFYQADTSHKTEGNGLGLALVKRILDLSNGEVTAENLDGGGCKFTVKLF